MGLKHEHKMNHQLKIGGDLNELYLSELQCYRQNRTTIAMSKTRPESTTSVNSSRFQADDAKALQGKIKGGMRTVEINFP